MKCSLSKSRYCSAIQCPKMLWLKDRKPEAYDPSCMNEAVLEKGHEVGDLARGLFGAYTEVPFGPLDQMRADTQRLIEEGTPVIAEASFAFDGLFCSVDILKNLGGKDVALYEVKSSTSVKPNYYQDAAFQQYVLTQLGYRVVSCNLVHLNNKYVRMGDLDLNQLFTIADITNEALALQPEVAANIDSIRTYMEQETEPAMALGMHCTQPYSCGFFGYCTKDLPKPNIFNVYGPHWDVRFELCNRGIVSYQDLADYYPLGLRPKLTDKQIFPVLHEVHKKPPIIKKAEIQAFLDTITYPVYFFDFESYAPAIPPYDNTRSNQHLVFQYSLHILEYEGAPLQHKEFLAQPGTDPRRAVAEQMCKDIPRDVCMLAWNKGFERGQIKTLAELYPDLRDHLMNLHEHFIDLRLPFQKHWYYCREMKGSDSIKAVLPALFPDDPTLDYHNLEGVNKGDKAAAGYGQMAHLGPEEQESLRKQLLAYCQLDTYAMVKILEKLKEICK